MDQLVTRLLVLCLCLCVCLAKMVFALNKNWFATLNKNKQWAHQTFASFEWPGVTGLRSLTLSSDELWRQFFSIVRHKSPTNLHTTTWLMSETGQFDLAIGSCARSRINDQQMNEQKKAFMNHRDLTSHSSILWKNHSFYVPYRR